MFCHYCCPVIDQTFENNIPLGLILFTCSSRNEETFGRYLRKKGHVFARLGFSISNNISPPRRLLCNNHENKYFIFIQPRQTNNQVDRALTFFLHNIMAKVIPCRTS